eukprot:10135609-Heterocapsa_arctica.AAC.1
MEVGASGHMMIGITDFEDSAMRAILDCPKFLLLPDEPEEAVHPDPTEEAARERLGELEFARALFAMNRA